MKMESLDQRHILFLKKVQMSSGGERQCGLGSLLPMSCRGRAEAFARRLHTRLRRLGSEPRPGEDSWLTAQPSQRRHLSESDVYFDFDVDLGSPSSPVEEVPEGALLPNGKLEAAVLDPESGCVLSSPAEQESPHSNSDSDATYYDLENDADLAASKVPNYAKYQRLYDESQAAKSIVNINKLKISASDIREQLLNCKTNTPDRQSPIKTQPLARENGFADYGSLGRAESGNSLYSPIRFDDCQMRSLERKRLALELEDIESAEPITGESSSAPSDGRSSDGRSSPEETGKDEVDFVVNSHVNCDLPSNDATEVMKLEISEVNVEVEADLVTEKIKEIDLSDNKCPENIVDKKIDSNDVTETEKDVQLEGIVTLPEIDEGTQTDEGLHLIIPENDGEIEDAEEMIEEDRPQRVRRCSSLRTGKTPPGTPGRKKIVRFADVLGLDLADVKTFMDDIPYIPKSAFEDLRDADLSLSSSESFTQPQVPRPVRDKRLVCMFQSPGDQPNFLDILNARSVCLENTMIQDGATISICGTVRVRNLDFHKSVQIRYTLDNWKTFSDLQASYVPNSCDGFCDRFTFLLYAHTLAIGQRLDFAVRFMCKGCQFWDNNNGINYCFQCVASGPQSNFYQPTSHAIDNWHPSFY